MLIHVKDIRSESQLTALISYIQEGYMSIEYSDNEKRRLKRLIRGACVCLCVSVLTSFF